MKTINKTLTTIILFSLISSCTWVGTRKSIKSFDESFKIDTQKSFYLIYPKNGFEKTMFTRKLAENDSSAKEVIEVFRNSAEIFGELIINDKNISLDEGFKEAKIKGSEYLLDVNISEWKDAFYMMCAPHQTGHNPDTTPATFDTVDLTIFVYDVKTKSLFNKKRIENKGCPIVLLGSIPIGKNSPESRLKPMLLEWIKTI